MSGNGYVHYGCGLTAPPTWTNFDSSPTMRVQKIPLLGGLLTRNGPRFPGNVLYGDIVRGLPVPPGSCKAIYCSHVLEHLALEDLRVALRNTFSYLEAGGTFRFVLPDLEQIIGEYVKSDDPEAAIRFNEEMRMGLARRPRGLGAFLRQWLGARRHLWMWDYKALARELEAAGFTEIRRARFGESPDPRFHDVEDEHRWQDCLGIECRKPGRLPIS